LSLTGRIAIEITLWTLASSSLVLASLSNASAGVLIENTTLMRAGVTRWFDVFEPDAAENGHLAVVVLLHGGTQDKNDMRLSAPGEYFKLADRDNFLLIIPNGSTASGATGPSGDFNWNDCRQDPGGQLPDSDDVGLISALLDWAETHYDVDPSRLYVTGASNGGLLAYRLALELSDRIAAIGAVIANLPSPSQCALSEPAEPISILIMNGTADSIMPWDGGEVRGPGGGSVLSALASRDFWRDLLQTDALPMTELLPDLHPTDAGRVTREIYSGGNDDSEIAFYSATGAGHSLPSLTHPIPPIAVAIVGPQNRDLEAAEEVWGFLSRQRLSVPEPEQSMLLKTLLIVFAGATRARHGRVQRRAALR
jgi:polyhydroxybutyrate depolymerase